MKVYEKSIIILLLSGFVLLFGIDKNLQNQFLIEYVLQSKLDSTLIPLFRNKIDVTVSYDHISDEKIAFLKTFFVDYLDKRGAVVHIDSGLISINIEQFDVNIVYTKSSASMMGLSEKINREVVVRLKGWLEDREDNRYIPINLLTTHIDEINEMDLDAIENSPYTFTKGVSIQKPSWKNYLEPVVVSISVVTVILLFFVLRT
jgi:hypothetical protein